jgi:anti-anti-sigma regulatory factor
MSANPLWLKVNAGSIRAAIEDAGQALAAGAPVGLDFSSIKRIDAVGVSALEQLAARAQDRGVPVTLRAVNPAIYKALKLVRLTPRFSFTN